MANKTRTTLIRNCFLLFVFFGFISIFTQSEIKEKAAERKVAFPNSLL